MSDSLRYVRHKHNYTWFNGTMHPEVGMVHPPRVGDDKLTVRVRTGICDLDVEKWKISDVEKIGMWEFIKSATYWYDVDLFPGKTKSQFYDVLNIMSSKWIDLMQLSTTSPADDDDDDRWSGWDEEFESRNCCSDESPFIGGNTRTLSVYNDHDDDYTFSWERRKVEEENAKKLGIDKLKAYISKNNEELSLTNN